VRPLWKRARLSLVLAALVAGRSDAVRDVAATDGELALDGAAEPEAARTLEVVPGDTLWSIAASAMGDGTLWPALYRANRDRIKDPARIYPGQHLAVPEVAPEAVASVRRDGEALVAD
jgi:nucleoid-associated protein YgaU